MKIPLHVLLPVIFSIAACTNNSADQATATSDEKFNRLFTRSCCGLTGADGTYSVLLPDGRSVWIFGDTFLGTVNPDGSRDLQTPMYIRNSFVVQDGDSLTTLHGRKGQQPASMVIPAAIENREEYLEDSLWFWPGDGLVENGELKVFLSSFSQPDTGMWGFRWESTWVAGFSLPGLKQISLREIPSSRDNGVHYGHAVMEDREYTYVYGAYQGRAHAARYPAGHMDEGWEFYTGTGWSGDPGSSKAMGEMDCAEQFSVIKIRDRYVFISQSGNLSPEIYSYSSDTPVGPWDNKSLLYTTPLPGDNKNLFTYNAVAHPQFTRKGKLLVSYNTNSFVLEDHFRNADIYRPRFIRVPLHRLDPSF